MSSELRPANAPGFCRTVWLLLGVARKRAIGRKRRQQELLNQRTGKKGLNFSSWGLMFVVIFMAIIHFLAAMDLIYVVLSAERVQAEEGGRMIVSRNFLAWIKKRDGLTDVAQREQLDAKLDPYYLSEAVEMERNNGGNRVELEQRLRQEVREHGSKNLRTSRQASHGFAAFSRIGSLPAMAGSLVLCCWLTMLVFQGEGLELDLQRRRHPMWEWLSSHPVRMGAVFLGEMLSPLAANPLFLSAPIFVGFVYGFVYGPGLGVLAGLLLGPLITVAAACLGKALEIAVILRLPLRSRGAVIGLMSCLGYASLMLFLLASSSISKIDPLLLKIPRFLTDLPWPWLGWFLGAQSEGKYSFLTGVLTCGIGSILVMAAALGFGIWGAQLGLGGYSGPVSSLAPQRVQRLQFGRKPLYRKDLLWFMRDRSALIQAFLIPLTMAGVQLFNLRGLLTVAQSSWNCLAGVGILFGTYFLWVLGPKSLLSEGPALWMTLTWPQGLESLLKAKAWLWSLISSGLVLIILLFDLFLFPAHAWQLALLALCWFFFSRSMAEKTVTLVTVPSSSGEPEKIPRGRMWGASLGMLTFAIGVISQQWDLALMGIVYSYVTAAAMWQNFRARLPYLYDPWSEKIPPAPTLMHAMIAISIMAEGVSILSIITLSFFHGQHLGVIRPLIYGLCAVLVTLGMAHFLRERGVTWREVWHWPKGLASDQPAAPWWCEEVSPKGAFVLALLLGVIGGLSLGFLARGYLSILGQFPWTSEILHHYQEQQAMHPAWRIPCLVMAVGFAPLAEEYLFRGLLFRALDREWGGWRAVFASGAFFAIYHPTISWLPVGLVGVANCLLFKKTGWLTPAVVLHMTYNLVVGLS